MITIKGIRKTYKISLRKFGFKRESNKEYKEVVAIDDVSFNVDNGEIIGILGSNGAGKTTLIKMMTGILTPTCGTIVINGYNPGQRKKEFLKSIGLMMGNRSSLFYDLPIIDTFTYLQTVYGVKKGDEYQSQVDELIKKLKLDELLDTPVRKLSLGQRKKAEVVASILHKPTVLFLDEPTIGLDVTSKKEMIEFIKFLVSKFGMTVLITSHDLNDIEKLCNRMVFIEKGNIAYDGKVSDFQSNDDELRKVNVIYRKEIDESRLEQFEYSKANDYTYSLFVKLSEVSEIQKLFSDEEIEELSIVRLTLEDKVLLYDKVHH